MHLRLTQSFLRTSIDNLLEVPSTVRGYIKPGYWRSTKNVNLFRTFTNFLLPGNNLPEAP
jgi:hypothetical protein